MNKLLLIVIALLLPLTASAEYRIYTIDNKFDAVFPFSPKLTGQAGSKQNRHKSYHYTDEGNIIVYNATYQVGTTKFNDNEVNHALSNYMQGQLKSVNGKLLSSRNTTVNGNRSIIFSMSFHHQ